MEKIKKTEMINDKIYDKTKKWFQNPANNFKEKIEIFLLLRQVQKLTKNKSKIVK